MFDLTLHTLLLRLCAALVIAAVHGFAVAGAARLLGDRGPGYDGRLTPNPFAHLDVTGSLALIVGGAGWSRPVAVDPGQLRGGAAGAALVVLAGCAATLAAAAALGQLLTPVATSLPDAAAPNAMAFIVVCARAAIATALLNLVPLPPLTGGLLLDAALPGVGAVLRRYAIAIGIALLALLATGLPLQIAEPATTALSRLFVGDVSTAASWR